MLEALRDTLKFAYAHPNLIRITTALFAVAFAIVIRLLRREAVSQEKWARYLEFAFWVFAVQYLVQFFGYFETHRIFGSLDLSTFLRSWPVERLPALVSILNNLFFLAAAQALLLRDRKCPRWARLAAMVCLAGLWADVAWYLRIPDALFSAYCIGLLGYAMSINIAGRKRRTWAILAIYVGFSYAITQIAYGFNPVFARHAFFAPYLEALISSGDYMTKLKSLDTLYVFAALPLKFGIFVCGLWLLVKAVTIVSEKTEKRILDPIVSARKEYLATDGIVKSIGEILEGDEVDLSVRLPGREQSRVASFKWLRGQPTADPEVRPLDASQNGPEFALLTEPELDPTEPREPVWQIDRDEGGEIVSATSNHWVGVPIRFHGPSIGYVRVKWTSAKAFSASTVQELKDLATLVAPAVQSHRELAALDQVTSRLTRLWSGRPEADFKSLLDKVAHILCDILSPFGIRIRLELGFVSRQSTAEQTGAWLEGLRPTDASSTIVAHGGPATSPICLHTFRDDLKVQPPGEGVERLLGWIEIVVPSDRDPRDCPTLGTSHLHRQALGSLVAYALLDFTRYHLDLVLKDLSVRENRRPATSVTYWLDDLEQAAKAVGLLWVAARLGNSEGKEVAQTAAGSRPAVGSDKRERLLGASQAVKIVRELPISASDTVDPPLLLSIQLEHPVAGTHNVIEVSLPATGGKLWLGVGRPEFGEELSFHSPWRQFLERLAEIADSGLARLLSQTAMTQLQVEAAQNQGLVMFAVATSTLMHQLKNLANNLDYPATALVDAIKYGKLLGDARWLRFAEYTKEYAEKIREVTASLVSFPKVDDRRPCRLAEAVEHAIKLSDPLLRLGEIRLVTDVAEGPLINVPFYVAAYAVANLIYNSRDAIGNSGTISVQTQDSQEMIICRVIDDGLGVPSGVEDRIWEPGFSTKKGGTGGGLFFVRRSLSLHGARIELTKPGPGGTEFTIFFPKPR